MLEQLLLGFAREAEGGVLGAGEAGGPRGRRQLLEVGFLDGVAAGVHGRGGVSRTGREKVTARRRRSRSQTTQTVCVPAIEAPKLETWGESVYFRVRETGVRSLALPL